MSKTTSSRYFLHIKEFKKQVQKILIYYSAKSTLMKKREETQNLNLTAASGSREVPYDSKLAFSLPSFVL